MSMAYSHSVSYHLPRALRWPKCIALTVTFVFGFRQLVANSLFDSLILKERFHHGQVTVESELVKRKETG